MKFSSQEEYGLRCLLEIARSGSGVSMTISEISEAEGLSQAYVAKLLRILRLRGFVESVRGQEGGYTLAQPEDRIFISDVLSALGGRFYKPGFCEHFSGSVDTCAHTLACSIRPLWHRVQTAIDEVLGQTTLADLLEEEPQGPQVKRVQLDAHSISIPSREQSTASREQSTPKRGPSAAKRSKPRVEKQG